MFTPKSMRESFVSQINSSLLEQSISKAVAYLEKQLDSITDSYTLCIVTYTLVLAKSSRAGDALKKRDALAQVSSKY